MHFPLTPASSLKFQIVCKENFKYEMNSPDAGVLPLERPPQPKGGVQKHFILLPVQFLLGTRGKALPTN